MKLTTLPVAALLLCAGIAIGGGLALQDQDERVDDSQPGPMHAEMAKRAGEYTAVTRFRPSPDAEPVLSRGSATIESVLGGRFLLENGKGEMLGQEYEVMRLWGFNGGSDMCESVWTYTMSTGMLVLTGKPNDSEGVDWTGTWTDAEGEHEMHVLMTFPDDDTHVLDMRGKDAGGDEFSMFVTTYTRKQEK